MNMEYIPNPVMDAWLRSTSNQSFRIKAEDTMEITSCVIKKDNKRRIISHEESNHRDKAKHGLKGKRKEEGYKACNYESKQKALIKAKKKDDIFDDITKEEADRLALLNICEEKHNALLDKHYDKAFRHFQCKQEMERLMEEMHSLEEELVQMDNELQSLENIIFSLKK